MANKKIIVILGPTSSGKSDLAVQIAEQFNGEIISADSRQVYRGMDIGTGKINKKEMRGIPHYLLDVASPKRKFTVVQYRNLAQRELDRIFKKGKVPIICGGTAFYIYALIDGIVIPKVKPDWRLRQKLERLNTEQLLKRLEKLDPRRAENIETKNRRRLIRALEIIIKTKKPVPSLKQKPLPYPILIIGIRKTTTELKDAIYKRLNKRLRQGMVAEVKRLKKSHLSWKRLESFGLEYRYIAEYLQGCLNYEEMKEKLQRAIEHFAKRQMTWFKRDKRIRWVESYKEAETLLNDFLYL
ncbi:MAG: tRNA (adenosine(37)-N6)-dimethylallyltransferase MiaA [Candidatus Nealsonbacteria bacterium]|nr:tRNA (adenosine(37)-N6)-dimethylallyltransferase MiaA [Candidatus Nealsonbacteria bacterium]